MDPSLGATGLSVLKAISGGESPSKASPSLTDTAISAIIGDSLREWRTQRLLSFMSKTEKIAARHGIDASKLAALPDGERYRIFDGATRSDDPLVEDMWASLLLTPSEEGEDRNRLIKILEQMTGDDARVLTFICCAESYGEELEAALVSAEKIKATGYIGKKKPTWQQRLAAEGEVPSRKEFEKLIEASKREIHSKQEPLKALDSEFLSNSDVYTSRDTLLRLGLIQRRSIDMPSSHEIAVSHTALTANSFENSNDWEDIETCDPGVVSSALSELHHLIAEHTGYSPNDLESPDIVQYNNRLNVSPWTLTNLGKRLYDICALRDDEI